MSEAHATPSRRPTGTLFWLPRILDDDRLDPTETLLLVAMADHINADDECWVGIERLAKWARVSYSTAKRRLADLEQRGIITRTRRRRDDGHLSTYTYALVRPETKLSPGDQPETTLVVPSHGSPRWSLAMAHLDEPAEPPSKEPPSKEPVPVRAAPQRATPEIEALCSLLADHVQAHSTTNTRPKITARWKRDMRLLVQRGPLHCETPEPQPVERVHSAIEFVFTQLADPEGRSGFCWADQIRSPGALRDHWLQLLDAGRRKVRQSEGPTAAVIREAVREIEQEENRLVLGVAR